MAARRKRTTGDQEGEPQGPKSAKKPTPLGTDTALTLPTSKGKSLGLTYWDVWFALVAVRDCGGDCGRLAERLRSAEELPLLQPGGLPSGSGATSVTWRHACPVWG